MSILWCSISLPCLGFDWMTSVRDFFLLFMFAFTLKNKKEKSTRRETVHVLRSSAGAQMWQCESSTPALGREWIVHFSGLRIDLESLFDHNSPSLSLFSSCREIDEVSLSWQMRYVCARRKSLSLKHLIVSRRFKRREISLHKIFPANSTSSRLSEETYQWTYERRFFNFNAKRSAQSTNKSRPIC